ncbi:class I SAM-dependent methyltransferase [Phenylobacterium sp.]|uniref:class I SAM-dependent methyltransferase n=1 Tax=Phenylobacterium sp. TaxID=1871053 RepID=UPI0039188C11
MESETPKLQPKPVTWIGPKAVHPARMALSAEEVEARRSPNPGPLEAMFYEGAGRGVTKWTHYLPIYDRVFAPWRGRPVRMLEIGVFQGGSLDLWRRYFGPDAVLFGVDIEPACAGRVTPPNQVRIGSQDDAAFLHSVVDEMGGLDIVLDDGSHIGRHQWASFRALWPRLEAGGMYLIEDLHSSYWPGLEGGIGRPDTGIGLAKALIDDMHGWYHGHEEVVAAREEIGGIEIADSILIAHKVAPKPFPGRALAGTWPKAAAGSG